MCEAMKHSRNIVFLVLVVAIKAETATREEGDLIQVQKVQSGAKVQHVPLDKDRCRNVTVGEEPNFSEAISPHAKLSWSSEVLSPVLCVSYGWNIQLSFLHIKTPFLRRSYLVRRKHKVTMIVFIPLGQYLG